MVREQTQIRPAGREECLAALELLLAAMPAEVRQSLAAELREELFRDQDAAGGLWLAESAGQMSAVGLAQLHLGQTASIWRPRFRGEEIAVTAEAILRACVEWSRHREVRVLQSLLEIEDECAAEWFKKTGFTRIARLAYLVWEANASPAIEPEVAMQFQSINDATVAAFAEMVEATYEQTLDCPVLNGIRSIPEVLQGYRAIGQYRPELWRLATVGEKPIGCLILAEHPAADQCELVYMGLIRSARGLQHGARLIAEAQLQTVRLGRRQLVLAVDLANTPALTHYHRAGFRVWDQRDVFAILNHTPARNG